MPIAVHGLFLRAFVKWYLGAVTLTLMGHQGTGCHGRMQSILASYSASPRFISRPPHRLIWLRYNVVFLNYSWNNKG